MPRQFRMDICSVWLPSQPQARLLDSRSAVRHQRRPLFNRCHAYIMAWSLKAIVSSRRLYRYSMERHMLCWLSTTLEIQK